MARSCGRSKGFPLRLMVPGFEGIFHTKYLRRIKVVDRYYMNYNDYGHLDQDPKIAALKYQIGPKSVITYPSGGHQLPAAVSTDQRTGLVGRRSHSQGRSIDRRRQTWNVAEIKGSAQRMAHARFTLSLELGRQRNRAHVALHRRDRPGSTVASAGRQALERAARSLIQRAGAGQHDSAVEDRERWERAQWERLRLFRL